jgi:hypothetical protein
MVRLKRIYGDRAGSFRTIFALKSRLNKPPLVLSPGSVEGLPLRSKWTVYPTIISTNHLQQSGSTFTITAVRTTT